MPLFVTVTPGTTVTSSTTLDASTLNLLGTPSVDVTGTVDGGSLSITSGSVLLTALAAQNASTLVGNASGSAASPTALTSTDLTFSSGTVNVASGAIVEAKLGARSATFAKVQAISTDRLLGRTSASSGDIEQITVGTGLTLSAGSLSALRPRTAFTNVEGASTFTISNNRSTPVEITPLTTQIQPQSASSKVLVQFNFSGEIIYTSAFILERVDGATVTPLGVPSSPGSNRIYGTKVAPFDSDDNSTQFNMAISFLDSPATTNTISYRIRCYCSAASAALGLNRSINDADTNYYMRATSQTILQEILPT